VTWDEGTQTLWYCNQRLEFSQFRQMLSSIADEAYHLMDAVLFGKRKEIFKSNEWPEFGRGQLIQNQQGPPQDITDNPMDTRGSVSYFNINRQFKGFNAVLSNIIADDPQLHGRFYHEYVDEEGSPVVQDDQMRQWLMEVDEVVDRILVLTYFLGGQPPRGTKHVSLRIFNTADAIRNIFSVEDMLIFFQTYTKTEDRLNAPFPIIRVMAHRIVSLIEVYIAVVRPLQERLYEIVGTGNGRPFSSISPLLFTRRGMPITSRQFSQSLLSITMKYTGHTWGIRDWRQMLITLGSKVLPSEVTSLPLDTTAFMAQSSHHHFAANRYYNRHESSPFHSSDSAHFSTFAAVSLAWHEAVGMPHPYAAKRVLTGERSQGTS
jgi:hypothetical protein